MEDKDRFKKNPATNSKELHHIVAESKQFEAKYYQMEKILKETQSRYKALFESTFSCVYIHDFEGKFIDANKTALKLLGYTKKEIPFLNISSFLDKDQLVTAFETIDEIKQTGYLKNPMIYKIRKKNEDYIWIEVIGTLIYHEGKPHAIQGIAQDITDRKRTEEALLRSEEQHRTMIETMNEGLSVVDEDGIMTYVNHQFCKMTGYLQNELIGHQETVLLDEENQNKLKALRRIRRRGGAEPYEIALTRKDGKKVYVLVSPRPIFDENNEFKGSFGIFTDITELKQTEEKLRSYQEQLRSLTLELTLVEERQRRHIAIELHDNIGQTLAYCNTKLREVRASPTLINLNKSLDEINSLLEQTIQYTKSLSVELGTPILYEVGLEAAVKWLGNQFQQRHGLVFYFEDDGKPKPLVDETRFLLYQAVHELLINAIKHGQARSIKVSIKRDYKNIILNVEDDGIGFDISKIEPYPDKIGGFGLFSIRERLKYLGGYLKVESKADHGTRVMLVLPLRYGKKGIESE